MKNPFAFVMMFGALLVASPVLADEEEPAPQYFMPAHLQPRELKAPAPGGLMALTLSGGAVAASGIGLTVYGSVVLGELQNQRPSESRAIGVFVGSLTLGLGSALTIAGTTMLGVGAARVVRYKKELQLAYRDPAQRHLVLGRIHRQMQSDRTGMMVTGTLAVLGGAAALGSGIGAAFGHTEGLLFAGIPGAVILGASLFPLIGFSSSYANEKALLTGGTVARPMQFSLSPVLSREMYGLSASGRF